MTPVPGIGNAFVWPVLGNHGMSVQTNPWIDQC